MATRRTLKAWTDRDLQDLAYGVDYYTNDELAFLLDRPVRSITDKIYRLGITRIKRRRYSKKEEELLENNIGIRPLTEIAKEIGRKPDAIYCKVFKMALNAPIHRKAA